MKGDFTRDTFDPTNHFSRVLVQQGRVTLDADYNEQTAILLYYLRTLARDLIGPYAAPFGDEGGFALTVDKDKNLKIGKGHYYVDGILVENDAECSYSEQPNYVLPEKDTLPDTIKKSNDVFWVYLDVWERHITSIEDDDIREKALNGPDTCTRAQVVWQVKGILQPAPPVQSEGPPKVAADTSAQPATMSPAATDKQAAPSAGSVVITKPVLSSAAICAEPLQQLVTLSNAWLAARADPGQKTDNACVTPPDSKYRGAENQLYRVEIHADSKSQGGATFKWSRDNGSVVAALLGISGTNLQVSRSRGFEAGDWVELSDDTQELQGYHGILVKLIKVEGDLLSVDPATPLPPLSAPFTSLINPKARRWNQAANEKTVLGNDHAIPVTESPSDVIDDNAWINIEDGVQIQFRNKGDYRTGDYWLIPARVATGQVEWPVIDGKPDFMPPDGIEHHYAPLGFVSGSDQKLPVCRCTFKPQGDCFASGSPLVKSKTSGERFQAEEVVAVSKQTVRRKKRTSK